MDEGDILRRCGAKPLGYFLPKRGLGGADNIALALLGFESLAHYEQYRAIAAALENRGWLVRGEGKRYEFGKEEGRKWFARQGVNFQTIKPGRYGLARQCLDWTERRPHLAGPVGAQLFKRWCERGWLERDNCHARLVKVTALGQRSLSQELGLTFCNGPTVDGAISNL